MKSCFIELKQIMIGELKFQKPERRVELVNRAHLLGHFQLDATVARLKEKYWWRNMEDTVILLLKQCVVCKKYQQVAAKEHPAQCLEVTGMFDRIGIDRMASKDN